MMKLFLLLIGMTIHRHSMQRYLFRSNRLMHALKAKQLNQREQVLDLIFAFAEKMLKAKKGKAVDKRAFWTNPRWTYIATVPRIIERLSIKSFNKSKTQTTHKLEYDEIKEVFGSINDEVETEHGGHWILALTEIELTFYKNKQDNN
eukprot:358779_1